MLTGTELDKHSEGQRDKMLCPRGAHVLVGEACSKKTNACIINDKRCWEREERETT